MKTGVLVLCFLCFSASLLSQEDVPAMNVRQLTDSIKVIMKEEHITGLMLGITTKDSVVFSGGFGYADLEAGRAADETTLFRMGSVTKMFVALGILQLVNEGKLRLDDQLKEIAPEVPFQNEWESTNPVRIIHLLEHTSGFDDMKLNRLYSADAKENTGIDMMLVHTHSMICRWRPGERFAYSNPNYAILGYVIEKLSGVSYHRYLQQNILDPLGMVHSNFNLGSRFPRRDVKEYIVKNGRTIRVRPVTLLSGAQGALWSCSADMLKFLQVFLRNGSPLFPVESIREMETAHSSLAARSGQINGYSLGNDNTFFAYEKLPFRGHDGLTGTCFSTCNYNRDLGVGFVLASNSNNNNDRISSLIASYLEQHVPVQKMPVQPIDKQAIAPFLGQYQFESPRNAISAFSDKLLDAPTVYFENGKLYFRPLLGEPAEIVQTAPMIFAWQGMSIPLICFTKNAEGKRVMMIGGSYYEQTSGFWAMFKRVVIAIAVVFALSTFISGIIYITLSIMGKLPWRKLALRLLPTAGVALLIWAVLNLFEVKQYTYLLSELGAINFRTMVIFGGTSAFAFMSLINLFYSIRSLRSTDKRWLAAYSLLVSLSLCLIMAILWQNGWIGLRTWSM